MHTHAGQYIRLALNNKGCHPHIDPSVWYMHHIDLLQVCIHAKVYSVGDLEQHSNGKDMKEIILIDEDRRRCSNVTAGKFRVIAVVWTKEYY